MKVLKTLAALFTSLAVLLLMGAFILNNFVYINKPTQVAVNSTALIGSNTQYGTGVVYINSGHTFMWTCHHVVASSIRMNVEFNGKTRKYDTSINTSLVKVSAKLFSNEPREVGEVYLWAKIIRFSENDDVALLELPHGYFKQSVMFPAIKNYSPLPGCKLFHVGNFSGIPGEKSITEGLCGVCGFDLDGSGNTYDRVGLNFESGSSGGGVFENASGYCIGLMARTTNRAYCHQGYIVPVRRLHEIARRLDCEWALTQQYAPGPDYLDTLTHDKINVPDEVIEAIRNTNP